MCEEAFTPLLTLFLHYENLPMEYRFFSALKIENFIGEKMIFLIFSFKTLIVGLTSTHNLCFGSKIRKIGINIGFKGVYNSRTCLPDVCCCFLSIIAAAGGGATADVVV